MERRGVPRPIQDVSETALMVAMWRAAENTHPNPLYRDPLALKLAGNRGREIIRGLPKRRTSMSHWMMAIRTRVIDDLIREAVADGVDLVLNLGAGLDTRPYRLELPSNLCWVEVDCAEITELKESRLFGEKPACKLERVSCDLAEVSSRRALLASASEKGRNALVLTEGVIPYLREEEVGALASDLNKYPCFRYWVADYFSPFIRKYRQAQSKKMRLENAPFKFAPEDYFGFFLSHGWQAKDVRYIVDAAQKLGRPAPTWVRVMFALRGLFLSPEKRDQPKNSMAYVLFEPCLKHQPRAIDTRDSSGMSA
ncbi:MAG TPA: class I SAM-dependent methyltransferase [Xanthobacteraceae bacterium]|nr:class I SAM-dependent methyltransferase [Xanthobacteraceae bacterium]